MKFDMGRAWNEAVALLAANKELLAVIAGIFIFLPNLALALFVPQILTGPATVDPENAMAAMQEYYMNVGPGMGLVVVIGAIGSLSMMALLTDRRPTVGEALKTGIVTLLPYLAAQILIVLGLSIVLGIPVGAAAGLGGPAAGVLVGLVALVVFVYVMIKLSLILPEMVLGGTLNPVTALTNAWKLTKGNSFRLLGFYLLLGVGMIVVSAVIGMVSGLFLAMLGQNAAGLLLGGALNGLLAAVWGALFVCILAGIYRQLAGPSASMVSEAFE